MVSHTSGDARRSGFVGSHVCERLLREGSRVVAVDNLITGRRANVAHLADDERFELIEADVSLLFDVPGPVDAIMHLASSASPLHYLPFPTRRSERLARNVQRHRPRRPRARAFALRSTSEVYGDPLVHPQEERYLGNVNPVGPRAVYDEGKRFGEAALSSATRSGQVEGESPASSTPSGRGCDATMDGPCRPSRRRRSWASPSRFTATVPKRGRSPMSTTPSRGCSGSWPRRMPGR
jgi:dTDP-D-glucose 4,6-dehydratase